MTGGVRLNYVPKDGGNQLSGSFFATGVNDKFQSEQSRRRTGGARSHRAEQDEADLRRQRRRRRSDQARQAVVLSVRALAGQRELRGRHVSRTRTRATPTAGPTCRIPSQQGVFFTKQQNVNGRLTWQATRRTRSRSTRDKQWRDWDDCTADPCAGSDDAVALPAAVTSAGRLDVDGQQQAAARGALQIKGEGYLDARPSRNATSIPVYEQSNGFFYAAAPARSATGRAQVAGCHHQPEPAHVARQRVLRHRLALVQGRLQPHLGEVRVSYNEDVKDSLGYQFNNGIPNLIYQRATPYFDGGYVMTRRTGPVRAGPLDHRPDDRERRRAVRLSDGYFPENHLGPAQWLPNRNVTFPRTDSVSWKDISPRLGVVYDLFGDGKTALKASSAATCRRPAAPTTPPWVRRSAPRRRRRTTCPGRGTTPTATSCPTAIWATTRPRIPGDGRRFCGTISDLSFGGIRPSTQFDPRGLEGVEHPSGQLGDVGRRPAPAAAATRRGHRLLQPVVWQLPRHRQPGDDGGRLHEVQHRGARRIHGCPTAAAITIEGIYDLNPNKVGQVNNLVTLASDYG